MQLAARSEWDRSDLAVKGTTDRGEFRIYNIFLPPDNVGVQAYLVRSHSKSAAVGPHFHLVDQFQFFCEGGGEFQGKEIAAQTLQYADRYSPYGPFVAGPSGLSFFVFRCQFDPIGNPMPASRDKLVGRPRGRRWVASVDRHPKRGERLDLIEAETDGLAAYVEGFAPGEPFRAAAPAATAGQFHLVLQGSCRTLDTVLDPFSCAHLEPDEEPLEAVAGDQGCELMTMRFPTRCDGSQSNPTEN